jgi:hypothetical protein
VVVAPACVAGQCLDAPDFHGLLLTSTCSSTEHGRAQLLRQITRLPGRCNCAVPSRPSRGQYPRIDSAEPHTMLISRCRYIWCTMLALYREEIKK